ARLDPRDRLLEHLGRRHLASPDQLGQSDAVIALELRQHAHRSAPRATWSMDVPLAAAILHQRRGRARPRRASPSRRSTATPSAPTMAPAPSDDISSPNPWAPSLSTSRAMSGTMTLKLSASRLTTTSSPSVKATGGVAAA